MPDVIDIVRVALNDDSRRLQSISQNMANVNTVGYKREIDAGFPAIETSQQAAIQTLDADRYNNQNVVKVRDISPGVIKDTGNKFDLAILQDGFFGVLDADGNMQYTRKGDFLRDEQGRIMTSKGLVLQGESGDVHALGDDFKISPRGEVIQNGTVVDKINLYSIATDKSEYVGGGLFKSSNASLIPSEMVNIRQGKLESSNVDSTYEMLKMIELTRRFESSSKVLGAYDRLVGDAISTLGNF